MNWRDLPSLNALKAFAAVAEHGSYSKGGAALNVTHSAVVQQIRSLERDIGTPLVLREGRGIALTEEGRRLAHDLAEGFRKIGASVEALTEDVETRPVQVTMSPAFATKWLMPRLSDFQTRHPEITLLLNPTGRFIELKPGGVDVAIRYARYDRMIDPVDTLLDLDLLVVGRPELLRAPETLNARDLLHRPWLQELGTQEVADWFARHGVEMQPPPQISHMPGNLIMDAVKRGDGITYTVREWVEQDIEKGDLIELFLERSAGQFYIHTLDLPQRASVRTFIRWLCRQSNAQKRIER
ncbi:LysR family transcriptional regulator [Ruegeria hyattellae]|uniref:LysR family transcriptional regulator n=1 Tax=Ruegeria hyattellae TaxID=3233337 RepID=UPI00355BA9C6